MQLHYITFIALPYRTLLYNALTILCDITIHYNKLQFITLPANAWYYITRHCTPYHEMPFKHNSLNTIETQ